MGIFGKGIQAYLGLPSVRCAVSNQVCKLIEKRFKVLRFMVCTRLDKYYKNDMVYILNVITVRANEKAALKCHLGLINITT